jgi:hypothetical protein
VETGKSPASRAALILFSEVRQLTMIRREIPRAVTNAHARMNATIHLVMPGFMPGIRVLTVSQQERRG